ncbi:MULTISPECIES: UDP-glucose 4-epimerase GalE [Lactobacillaceae]|uniref:UDP-glucose 4-epimerase n=1 Tax=Acetilactobacillus jinshanensis TaxID=1720083 RepID=A0A4P6ZIV2_9LACO|nr:UDP-glucose 4-epimerase GalE [Acetilactobacillus jinshanensis]QBP17635.1 UDP-glucose 4-epimerase GalE [Acetilactobacillus jinshanensis]URL61822.1 UDP-glucose 4-epimerase GalE [uncultured bacterium]
MTTILVTGGAGYIGSHTVDRLIHHGFDVVVVDNLMTGHRQAINSKARFYQGDIRDQDFLNQVFDRESIAGVIHFASVSIVPESMKNPLKYFDDNVKGTITLLEVMHKHHVKRIVFSSSAATYGEPKRIPIKETDPQIPTNPYGETKLMMEKIMQWSDQAYGIHFIALRYFNVGGAKLDGSIGEDHSPETHLIPIILQVALGKRSKLQIFGDDYPTKDGTNVRDYVHVLDLADAHILAMKRLLNGGHSDFFNLGSSTGFSNLQMLKAARDVTGKPIPAEMAPRRPGDPSTLIADSTKARKVLGWSPKYDDVHKIIGSAWRWARKHPNGYDK